MMREDFGTPLNIAAAATTVVKKGTGDLVAIIVNKALGGDTITVYDSITATGTKIATVTFPATLLANQLTLPYFCKFTNGLTVVTSGNDDITVIYK